MTVICAGPSGGPLQNGEGRLSSHTAMAAALWHRAGSGAPSSKSPST